VPELEGTWTSDVSYELYGWLMGAALAEGTGTMHGGRTEAGVEGRTVVEGILNDAWVGEDAQHRTKW
jgi:hypothetical protein